MKAAKRKRLIPKRMKPSERLFFAAMVLEEILEEETATGYATPQAVALVSTLYSSVAQLEKFAVNVSRLKGK